MIDDHMPLVEVQNLLARLPSRDVEAAGAERVRQRCHAALVGRRGEAVPATGSTRRLAGMVEPGLVALLSVAYLSEVVGRALSLLGL